MATWKKVVFVVLGVILVVVSMCPTAFAAPINVYASCSEPSTDGEDGYVEYLIERGTGTYEVLVCSWQVLDHYTQTSDTSSVTPSGDLFVDFSFSPSSGASSLNFHWQYGTVKSVLVTCVYRDYVNYYAICGNGENVTINPMDMLTLDDNSQNAKAISFAIHSGINLGYVDFNPDLIARLRSFIVSYGGFSAIHMQMNDIVTFLVSTYLKADSIDKNLAEYVKAFNDNLWLVEDIDMLLYQIYEYMTTNLDYTLGYILDHLYAIRINTATTNEKLDIIIELLNKSGEAEFSDPDTSNIDDYYDVENSLLDSSNIDSSSAISVEVDQNAMAVIWDIVNSFLNVHPVVIGLVITILSLSLIALILGR